MKLRNKKTGLLGELKDFINDGFIVKVPDGRGVAGYKYDSLTALNKEWEDYKPIESSKCYLINEETGYIITFDNKNEMEVFDVENHRYIPVEQTEGLFTKIEMDYHTPAEPLIKDEEIREIIRAWAKINDAMELKYNYDENSLDDIYRNTITFNMGLGLKDGGEYTITELCGEEE